MLYFHILVTILILLAAQFFSIMSDPRSTIAEGRNKRVSSTSGLTGKRKKAKTLHRIKGIGTRTRSSFVSIKSRLRTATNDCTHKTTYEYTQFELQRVSRNRVGHVSQSHSQADSATNLLPTERGHKEPVHLESDLNCLEKLLRSFALVANGFVQFLDAQNILFQNAQPQIPLCAPLGEGNKYRKQKIDKLKYLKDALFSTESADYHPIETSFTGAISFFLENILR